MDTYTLLRKSVVIGIILLFFGASVVSATNKVTLKNDSLSVSNRDQIDQSHYTMCFKTYGKYNDPPIQIFINGPHYGKVNTVYTFSVGPITNPESDQFYGLWDFGDGSQGSWQGPYESGQTFSFSHAWSEPGNYTIKVKIKDSQGVESDWSAPFFIEIVQLKTGLFLGTYKNFSETSDLWIIHAQFCIVFPLNLIFNKGKTIVISKDCLFYRGLKFTIGVGGIAVV
jgi:hypothetical protein